MRGDGRSQHYYLDVAVSGLGYAGKLKSEAGHGRLVCRACGYERILTPAWIDELRARVPEIDCESEALARFLHLFRCSHCQTKDVELVPEVREERVQKPADDGDLSPLCTECGEAIAVKRLRAVPGTPFCIRCQEQFEHGQLKEEPVYCNECGAKMAWRIRESILPAKYFLGCSNYPRCRFVIAGSW